jgi:hypothetical protein
MEKAVSTLILLLRMIAVLAAAAFVGNWFLTEVKKARMTNKPWYQPYVSIPGVVILLAVLFPVILWILKNYL